jgi:hypothetical protein
MELLATLPEEERDWGEHCIVAGWEGEQAGGVGEHPPGAQLPSQGRTRATQATHRRQPWKMNQ